MNDPAILLLIPIALLLMVGVAAPLEGTQRGRDFMDAILRRWFS